MEKGSNEAEGLFAKGFISFGMGREELELPAHSHVLYVEEFADWVGLFAISPILEHKSSYDCRKDAFPYRKKLLRVIRGL